MKKNKTSEQCAVGAETSGNKKSHAAKWMIAAIVLLAAVIGITAFQLHAGDGAGEADGTLTITRDGETVRKFSYEEICSMDSISVEKEIVSSSKKNESGVYTGVPLRSILEEADDSMLTECSEVIGKAADGFVSAYSMSEVRDSDGILVIYEKDGEPLKGKADGGSGPLRILAADDVYGTRSTMYLTQVDIASAG